MENKHKNTELDVKAKLETKKTFPTSFCSSKGTFEMFIFKCVCVMMRFTTKYFSNDADSIHKQVLM